MQFNSIEKGRVKTIKKIYKDIPHTLMYKVYYGIDNVPRVSTYMLLEDGFNTLIKLEDIGVFTCEVMSELESAGYKQIKEINILVKK